MRKVKMGMVGGGDGAFIGAVHRHAAALDGMIDLVCGCFASTPEKSRKSGKNLGLPADRVYGTYAEMMAAEAALPVADRMDFVAIVTPNHMHFPVAKAALDAGFHVLSDKPATLTLDESKALKSLVDSGDFLYGLTHNYTGYPAIKEARDLVKSGALGPLRKVVVEYLQGWLAGPDDPNDKQAAWRTDPARAGAAGCFGDIGSHAANLAEYVTGAQIEEICADLSTFVEGRMLDDDSTALLKLSNNIKGVLNASQIAVGEENNLTLRVYGEKGGLEWRQQEPNTLTLKWSDNSQTVRRTGNDFGPAGTAATRTPGGHPEGYLEAFANIYRAFAARILGEDSDLDFPSIDAAVHGMAVIEGMVAASASDEKWFKIKD
ncbi:MAG: Gfo/Idh/MocA family protein [Alphaproteobacteria bacterium]